MKKIALICLFLFGSLTSIGRAESITPSYQGEHLSISFPQNEKRWCPSIQTIVENGRVFEIWVPEQGEDENDAEERIVLITLPWKLALPKDIGTAVDTLLMMDDDAQIIELSDNEALVLIGSTDKPQQVVRVIVTPYACHLAWYESKVQFDAQKWFAFLKSNISIET